MVKNLILGLILARSAPGWGGGGGGGGPKIAPPPLPTNFLQILPLLVVRHCSKLSSHAI